MSDLTKDEALAFVEAMRLTLKDKVGFQWLVAKLSSLEGYIESVAADNDRLESYIDHKGLRTDYEAHREGP